MSPRYPKLVDTPHYHIWTDALHARALARQARNKWDRSTYIRWTIITGWTTFEAACEEALGIKGLGHRFKDNMDKALEELSLPNIKWGAGIWQEILLLYKNRKNIVHPRISNSLLFHNLKEAEDAIIISRKGIEAIFLHAKKTPPTWIQDDEDRGWDYRPSVLAHGMAIHEGADPNDLKSYKIAYVFEGTEYIQSVYPGKYSLNKIKAISENLIQNINIPVSLVRIYHGPSIIIEKKLNMRGA